MQSAITIKGARENNLKNLTVSIPKHQLVVLTGPSGSGKSTLALDTLQRECQRQYMESMGMITDSISKPKVDAIVGLSPSISVGQHMTNRNPRSTVGTVTEIYTYLRVLYAKRGTRICPSCGTAVTADINQSALNSINEEEEESGDHLNATVGCPGCGHLLPLLTAAFFSFNKPEGACHTCHGIGHVAELQLHVVFNEELSFRGGCVTTLYDSLIEYYMNPLAAAYKHYGIPFDPDQPLREYSPLQRALLFYGVEHELINTERPDIKPPRTVTLGKFEGFVPLLWRRYHEKEGDQSKLGAVFSQKSCSGCGGTKLNDASRAVKVGGVSISEVTVWPLAQVIVWLEAVEQQLPPDRLEMFQAVFAVIPEKLKRIVDVGLGYLSLNRQAITLSGGESQRLRLASLLGSGLTGVLYILDEPTAGLHPKNTAGLIGVLKKLRDMGNTVLVIEHDVEMMRAADHIIDIGPGAGSLGGMVVGQGSLLELMADPHSVTGRYLQEENCPPAVRKRRSGNGYFLHIIGACARNLKQVSTTFPLGCFIAVTGVSGSGKSTLLFDLLADGGLEQKNGNGGYEQINGLEHIGSLITVDQSPLGRMQRSNIATYTEVFTGIRNLFAALPEAKRLNLTSKHFSFNTAGGRCETCQGLGVMAVEMFFLHDVEVRCPACRGRRFKAEVLQVTYKGHTISGLLDITVKESLEVFEAYPKIADTIQLLCEVGLGYLQWGQSVTTLSGGEGQRIKLAKELSKKTKKHTLYLLDEPSTGLHPTDVRQLHVLLSKLVQAGNTVIVVEHNMELVREADWVVDLGPEGGEAGGQIMAQGTPEMVAQVQQSHTGRFLKQALAGG